jgi:hypothetical protein
MVRMRVRTAARPGNRDTFRGSPAPGNRSGNAEGYREPARTFHSSAGAKSMRNPDREHSSDLRTQQLNWWERASGLMNCYLLFAADETCPRRQQVK